MPGEAVLKEAPSIAAGASPEVFRQGMRRLAGGVCVLTSDLEGAPVGLTATAVTSLCAEPPRLLACVNRKVYAYTAFEKSRSLCVNVLSVDDLDIAKRFAGMTPGVSGPDRFAEGRWHIECGKAPVLEGALASFQCCIVEIIPACTHSILICDVLNIAASGADAAPLVYANGQFRSAALEV